MKNVRKNIAAQYIRSEGKLFIPGEDSFPVSEERAQDKMRELFGDHGWTLMFKDM